MRQTIKLGRIAGIPVGVNWSVALIFALITWELAVLELPSRPGAGVSVGDWAAALAAALLFFGSLLAHELTHAVVARRHGVGVHSITLWLFGGVAQLDSEASSPGEDFRIAAAGPAMSLALVGLFAGLTFGAEHAGAPALVVDVLQWLWRINLLLAAFNLIPAAPLDGGRILRAGLWRHSGDRTRASVTAAGVGRVFGAVLITVGVYEFLRGSPLGLWPALLGWFLFQAAGAEAHVARLRHDIAGLRTADVMQRDPPIVRASMSAAELAPYLHWYRSEALVLVDDAGWLHSVVSLARLAAVDPADRARTRLGDVAVPVHSAPVARPDEPLGPVLDRIAMAGGTPAIVLDPANRLAGLVTSTDAVRAGRAGGARRS